MFTTGRWKRSADMSGRALDNPIVQVARAASELSK